MLTVLKLIPLSSKELTSMAKEFGAKEVEIKKAEEKVDLIRLVLQKSAEKEGYVYVKGVLEVLNKSKHGLLRTEGVLPGESDVYVSASQIEKFGLRTGDVIEGVRRQKKEGEKYSNLLKVDFVGGRYATESAKRPIFNKMVPIFPDKQIKTETKSDILSTRIIDMLAPIGYGQRGLIVSPPKAGKTWLLQAIANGITANNKDISLFVVLVGERPEEVTDMQRSVDGEVWASNFDEHPEHNVKVAEMALEKAKRMVEWGQNVVILMDSITRLARAYNLIVPSSGRTLSGGFDPVALYPPKRFFGAARNFEKGGSLTIIATALINTGSRMDDLIYEEFKGTGNMELHLDRNLADRRIYPAIDVLKSGTRREDLLLGQDMLQASWLVRKMLDTLKKENEDVMPVLIQKMKNSKNNKEFVASLRE